MPLLVGDRLGHYDVTALIAQGGMGEVCRARDIKLNAAQEKRYEERPRVVSQAPRADRWHRRIT